jgi:hypothetical protein
LQGRQSYEQGELSENVLRILGELAPEADMSP